MTLRNKKRIVLTLALIGIAGCARSDYLGAHPKRMLWQPITSGDAGNVPRAPEPKILPETYFAAARLFEQQGLIDRAINQYRKAIAVNHNYVAAYHRLGVLLNTVGIHDEATRMLQHAVALKPDNVILRNNLGFSLMLQQDWGAAEQEFRRATAQQPDFVRAHVNLGMVLAQQHRFDEALASFRDALPEADAYYNLGLMFRTQHRFDRAADAFRHVLELDPKFTAAQAQLEQVAEHQALSIDVRVADAGAETSGAVVPPTPDAATRTTTMSATITPQDDTAEAVHFRAVERNRDVDSADDPLADDANALPNDQPQTRRDDRGANNDSIIPALRLAMERAHQPLPGSGRRPGFGFESYVNVLTEPDEQAQCTIVLPACENPSYRSAVVAVPRSQTTRNSEPEPFTVLEPMLEFTEFSNFDQVVTGNPQPVNVAALNAGSEAMIDAFDRLMVYFPGDVWCWDGVDWESWETVDVVKLAEADAAAESARYAAAFGTIPPQVAVRTAGPSVNARPRGSVATTPRHPQRHVAQRSDRTTPYGEKVNPAAVAVRSDRQADRRATGRESARQAGSPADRRTALKSLEVQLAEVRDEIQCWDEVLDAQEFSRMVEPEATLAGTATSTGSNNVSTLRTRRQTAAAGVDLPTVDVDREMALPMPPVDPSMLEAITGECPSVFDTPGVHTDTSGEARVVLPKRR